ncbi:hypothetical protein B0H12DRAFT_1237625 [Mycena haematopus]|nr:hypothetical protein B0H12DRAFT_1237625 [Mycena haematopus]
MNLERSKRRHRHTQSLGLLSPIPSTSSLVSDAAADEGHATQETRPCSTPQTDFSMSTTTTPSKPQTPSPATSMTTTTPSTHRRARTSLPPLPALLAGLSALFPGNSSAPSSPKVAQGMPLVSACDPEGVSGSGLVLRPPTASPILGGAGAPLGAFASRPRSEPSLPLAARPSAGHAQPRLWRGVARSDAATVWRERAECRMSHACTTPSSRVEETVAPNFVPYWRSPFFSYGERAHSTLFFPFSPFAPSPLQTNR